MRTIITLADDAAVAVKRTCRERGIGASEAVNELIRQGLGISTARREFRQRTRHMAMRIDVTGVADAVEALDGPATR